MSEKEYVSKDEYDELFAALEDEIEAHKATKEQADLADEYAERVLELEGKVRGRAHRDAFAKLADDLGVSKDGAKREDLYALARWAEDGDEPDLKAMRKHFEPLLQSRSYLLDEKAEKEKEKEKAPLDPEEGAGRGKTSAPSESFKVRPSDLADADWMFANQDRFAEASAAGNVVFVD